MLLWTLCFCVGLILGLGFTSQRDATNAGVGTVNALFMLGGKLTVRNKVWTMIVLNTRDGKSRPALITVNRNQNFLMSEIFFSFFFFFFQKKGQMRELLIKGTINTYLVI